MDADSRDEFRDWDAAYVLGALDDADRTAFERHLRDCAQCRARVAEVGPTADLLAAAGPLPAPEPPPETLLPGLLRRVQRERARRRLLVGGLGAVAAACVVAAAVALWPAGSPTPRPSRPFVAVQSAPVEARGILVSRSWGTQINIECRYTERLKHGRAYRLVVVDDAERRYDAGGWTLGDGTTEFTGGTEVPRDRIAAVQITLADGRPVLQLTP